MSQQGVTLDHCVIHVSNWEQSNAFYRDVMGAEVIAKGDGWVYQFGSMRLNVHGPGVEAHPVARVPVPPGGSDLCFAWPGTMDGVLAHLAKWGVEVELGPVPRGGANGEGNSVYFRDPDGSLLEFITYAQVSNQQQCENAPGIAGSRLTCDEALMRQEDLTMSSRFQRMDRRRLLQVAAASGLVLGGVAQIRRPAAAQDEVTFSKDYDGVTLNLLMEDLLETQIIEDMLPEFKELTGITVNFEKVAYGVMHEKLVPQLAAGPGNGTYDVLEVDFYWVYEFARSNWVEALDERIANSGGAIALDRYIPATLDIVGRADDKMYYVPFYAYPMGLIYREDLANDDAFKADFKAASGLDFAMPDSVESYVEMAKAITAWKGEELYGTAMTGQQVDPITMEFCNYLYSCGGDFYNADMSAPAINDANGVKAASLYVDAINNAAQTGAASANYDDSIAVYAAGNAFSSVSFMWMLTVVDGDKEAAAAGKNSSTIMPGGTGLSGAWGWGIPLSSPNPDAGWEFVRWVESPDVAMRRAIAGSLPTQQAPYENDEVLKKFPWLPKAGEMITSGKGLPAITKQTQLVEITGRRLAEAVAGTPVQEAMDAAAAELAELL